MVNLKKFLPKSWVKSDSTALVEEDLSDDLENTKEISAYRGIDYGSAYTFNMINSLFNGDKFPGGFGITKEHCVDYWTLRARSVQLFTENLYAKGLINRLITNEINVGLTLEATPSARILKKTDEYINDWAENTEEMFKIWGDNKNICDWKNENTFGQLQQQARMLALLSGDVVVILRQSTATRLPIIELIDGTNIINPSESKMFKAAVKRGNKISHGIELDSNNRHIAYYVKTIVIKNGKTVTRRVPVKGEKSGRTISFMLYGIKKRIDEVRGVPILALILQSLKEIDRYRDSEQRAAVINSILALYIKKEKDAPGSRPVTGGAVRKGTEEITQEDGTTKRMNLSSFIPGIIQEELQVGEEPKSFDTKRPNVNFKAFEDVIVSTMAWALEIPPEILLLSFNSNYSASQAALSEFKMYLNLTRANFATDFNKIIYPEWLINMVLTNRIEAPGLIESSRLKNDFLIFGAWVASDWAGAIKPQVDLLKTVKYYKEMIKEGLITHDRASKELNGMKYATIIRILKKENELLADAKKPLIDGGLLTSDTPDAADVAFNKLEDLIDDKINEANDDKLIELKR